HPQTSASSSRKRPRSGGRLSSSQTSSPSDRRARSINPDRRHRPLGVGKARNIPTRHGDGGHGAQEIARLCPPYDPLRGVSDSPSAVRAATAIRSLPTLAASAGVVIEHLSSRG